MDEAVHHRRWRSKVICCTRAYFRKIFRLELRAYCRKHLRGLSKAPDRHWLVYQQTTNSAVLAVADLLKPTDNPVITALPATEA